MQCSIITRTHMEPFPPEEPLMHKHAGYWIIFNNHWENFQRQRHIETPTRYRLSLPIHVQAKLFVLATRESHRNRMAPKLQNLRENLILSIEIDCNRMIWRCNCWNNNFIAMSIVEQKTDKYERCSKFNLVWSGVNVIRCSELHSKFHSADSMLLSFLNT